MSLRNGDDLIKNLSCRLFVYRIITIHSPFNILFVFDLMMIEVLFYITNNIEILFLQLKRTGQFVYQYYTSQVMTNTAMSRRQSGGYLYIQ